MWRRPARCRSSSSYRANRIFRAQVSDRRGQAEVKDMSVMEFLSMGGHGPYIWGSYGVMALLMIIEARQVIARKRKALALQRSIGYGDRS